MSMADVSTTRRQALNTAFGAAATAIACSSAAYADVSQGNLPDSAYAFLRMIQAQKDWAAIGAYMYNVLLLKLLNKGTKTTSS
jgi:hypothetical protein